MLAVLLGGFAVTVAAVIAEKTDSHGFTAWLVRLDDGSIRCQCPYACLAAMEPCAFTVRLPVEQPEEK